jgi:ribonucleoside-diphosphate reductase alpha subunit
MSQSSMHVIKRNGNKEEVSFDKVLRRIQAAGRGLEVNPALIAQKVLSRIYDGVHTSELDELAAHLSSSLATVQPDYGVLAAQIAISNHQANTTESFSEVMIRLANQTHPKTGKPIRYISAELEQLVRQRGAEIDAVVKNDRDFLLDYFGFKTLERSYLLKDAHGKIQERPQHMWMRVALGIWGADLEKAFETYDVMSMKRATHATPTLFNAGTPNCQLSSCYLLAMDSDSIGGIYKTLGDCAQISKHAGGIGLHVHNIRAKGSLIGGTNGVSNGLVPMLRVYNSTARYVDQGGQKRNGSFAIYLEPWHADIEDFLRLKLNTGADEERARDLFYAIWMNDLFMERVEAGGDWTLFCPAEAPGLADVYGAEFRALYEKYEAEGRGRRSIPAQKLWFKILDSQIETGTPYIVYKDAANAKSNQKNLGTIKSSNLCTEILEYSSPEETAVCNLASIALPAFVKKNRREFDFDELRRIVRIMTRNLNKVIDINYYPTPETRRSNMRHRPIGLGVQGLADVFAMMKIHWESDRAAELNQRIFEHIYYAALTASANAAVEQGPYETFAGSPASQGILQYDMWGQTPLTQADGSLDWAALKAQVVATGLRNSLLVAPMPTASTSQILGWNECFEPFTSNIYTRRTLAGEFIVVNKHLVCDLMDYQLWNEDLKQKIIANNGSVQGIAEIPASIQERYKTAYEIKQRTLIDMAAARGAFICQSQSLNLFVADPTYAKLTSMHFHGWKKGLKTGIYYLRTKAPAAAQKFTVDPDLLAAVQADKEKRDKEKFEVEEGCTMCSA